MNEIDIELYRLLADKTPTIGCKMLFPQLNVDDEVFTIKKEGTFAPALCETLGHEPTIADFHKWLYINAIDPETWFTQDALGIQVGSVHIEYLLTHSLLSQSEETKLSIINLITSHS